MAKYKKDMDVLHCVNCGAANRLRDNSASLGTCVKCGKVPVEALGLLSAGDMWSGDSCECSVCQTCNSVFHRYCFACGKKVGT